VNFIFKQKEPAEFLKWKKTIGTPGNSGEWYDFKQPDKEAVHQSLLREQGFVCCYCEQGVSKDKSHIEHIKPQSSYPQHRFDYQNMLASCEGNDGRHCGHKKDNWYDPLKFVTPLVSDCTTFFIFTSAGEIKPTDNPERESAANETINRLNLNHSSLIANRKAVLNAIFDIDLTTEELMLLKKHYGTRKSSGQFSPFRSFVDYILGSYITKPTTS
jgi:uncharacterized protein (TIGR02646 family)